MARTRKFRYDSEAEMCARFIETVRDDPVEANRWTAYPETCDYDIVLERADGCQVAIEAKNSLNAKVIAQALGAHRGDQPGPDYRALLVPLGYSVAGCEELARHCGLTVIRAYGPDRRGKHLFSPNLPRAVNNAGHRITRSEYNNWDHWRPWYPASRLVLPDYVPDVVAGVKGPVKLSLWKIKALKIMVILAKRGWVTRSDFRHLDINPTLWMQRGWLIPTAKRGVYKPGRLPDFPTQHPVNYAEIEADFETWAPESAVNDVLAQRF